MRICPALVNKSSASSWLRQLCACFLYLSEVVGEVDGSVMVMRGEGIAKTSAKGASHHYRQTPPEDPTELHEIKLRVPLPRGSDAHLKRLNLAIAADPKVCAGRNSRLSRHGDKVEVWSGGRSGLC